MKECLQFTLQHFTQDFYVSNFIFTLICLCLQNRRRTRGKCSVCWQAFPSSFRNVGSCSVEHFKEECIAIVISFELILDRFAVLKIIKSVLEKTPCMAVNQLDKFIDIVIEQTCFCLGLKCIIICVR